MATYNGAKYLREQVESIFNAISHDYRDKYGEDYWSHYVYHYCRFYPYASVIEKSTDEDREFFYQNWDIGKQVNKSEY